MSQKIVAIGGGENGRLRSDGSRAAYETRPMDGEIISLTGKKHPHFLFLAHSQLLENQAGYFETMKSIYGGRFGCACRDLKSNELEDQEKVLELISWADIIYEGGGNTLDMIDLWKKTGFDKILYQAWLDGKVLCGVSAGANCWFQECSSDSLIIKYGPGQPLIGMECLGFLEGLFVPHADEVGREESVKEILKTKDQIGLFFSNCSALEVVDDQYRIITSNAINYGIEAYAKRAYWEEGEYYEEKLDLSSEWKPFQELLERNISKKGDLQSLQK